jgi:uncharacterized membrane protein YfcA
MLLLGMDEKSAIASSLAIVSVIAVTGAFSALKHKTLQPKIVMWFVLTSLPAASFGAYLGTLLADGIQTILLTIIMLLAASKMFSTSAISPSNHSHLPKLLVAGALTGLVTGLVGVGGGFLIVPALVLYAGLTMQQSVANSLALIAFNGATAFFTLYQGQQMPEIDWIVIAVMAGVGSIAVLAGQKVANRLDQGLLKKVFAGLLVLVALGLIVKLIWL